MPHGFPGKRPTLELQAKTGAGNDETRGTMFRLAHAELGPLKHDDRLVQIEDPPDSGIMAGLVGNELFSRYSAVVFDLAKRSLWLEPPCNRPSPESKAGWRLAKNDVPEFKGKPWVVEKILHGGTAALAGLLVGDRLLSVGGVAADLDVSKIQTVVEQAAGTKVSVVLDRKGERKTVTMTLHQLLAP